MYCPQAGIVIACWRTSWPVLIIAVRTTLSTITPKHTTRLPALAGSLIIGLITALMLKGANAALMYLQREYINFGEQRCRPCRPCSQRSMTRTLLSLTIKYGCSPICLQILPGNKSAQLVPRASVSPALPGSDINLTGYKWASVEDMNALFNYFMRSETPDTPLVQPEPSYFFWPEVVLLRFFNAGWRSWRIRCLSADCSGSEWGLAGATSTPFCYAVVSVNYVYPSASVESGVNGCDELESPNSHSNRFPGAWFYRPL
jgi:hypothetical protein